MFKGKVKQAQSILQTSRIMEKELLSFEKDENAARPGIPAVYSAGGYKPGDFRMMLKINVKPLFVHLIETVTVWKDLALNRVNKHNAELNELRKDCGLNPLTNRLKAHFEAYFKKLVYKEEVRAKTEVEAPNVQVHNLEA
jgi:hypothetical protein